MVTGLVKPLFRFLRAHLKKIVFGFFAIWLCMLIALVAGKTYQHWDTHPSRGAIAWKNAVFNDGYDTPQYLDQGWSRSDSLWFYNTTQGSALLPYDFFMSLEQANSQALVRANANIDKYRYLPQEKSFFNPDALPVGFVKDTYKGKSYIGFTCAACHTSQVNYADKKTGLAHAIRIDGGPSMADMPGFLQALERAMEQTLADPEKFSRFAKSVLARKNDFRSEKDVRSGLEAWALTLQQYNIVNHTSVEYGYARLDAFGRIYNRVLQHVINKAQARNLMLMAHDENNQRLMTTSEVDLVLEGIDPIVIGNREFAEISKRLRSNAPGYPGLTEKELLIVRDELFNEPNAPVSYPFLWDITHSDYVQWNGLASNAGVGPLGRNVGEVIGVFGILDWTAREPGFSLAAKLSGQSSNRVQIDFTSSIDQTNLRRLEFQLKNLKSPQWPEEILGKIDREAAARGELLYAEYCQSCHEVIDRNNWDRIVVGKMSSLERIKTDPQMAENSVNYSGKSGNFEHTYQSTDVGSLVLEEQAPVAMLLTAATKGVVATPDPDKWFVRRWLDWLYNLGSSFFDNDIKASVKVGNYQPDTTAKPFNSLLAYKARSLNGIWATAPYLHNGSVPTLYDLLLPAEPRDGDPEGTSYRPATFEVGSRLFDPEKVGFVSKGYGGFVFDTTIPGNRNTGHEYAAGHSPQPNGEVLPGLSEAEKHDLLEFLKTL